MEAVFLLTANGQLAFMSAWSSDTNFLLSDFGTLKIFTEHETLGEPSRQRVLTVGFYVPFHVGDDKALLRTDSLAVFLFLHIILYLEICRL